MRQALLRMLDRIRVGVKLPAMVVALTALAITIMGYGAYQNARETINRSAEERLTGIAEGRMVALTDWLAESPSVEGAISAFARSWSEFQDPAAELQSLVVEESEHPVGERHKLNSAGHSS